MVGSIKAGAGFGLLLVLVCGMVGSLPGVGRAQVTATENLPRSRVVNVDHRGFPYDLAFDVAADGTNVYLWNVYRSEQERVVSTTFDRGRRSRTIQLSAGGGLYYEPVFVSTGSESGWAFWQARREGTWQIVGRRLDDGRWLPLKRLSEVGVNALHPAAVVTDGSVVLAWEDHGSQPQQIRIRRWSEGTWETSEAISRSSHPAYRPSLAANPDGTVWLFWDQYERPRYEVYGRRVSPDPGSIRHLSTTSKSSLNASAVYSPTIGFAVAWISVVDVVGGEGVLDQWNTVQVAVHGDGRWRLTESAGSPTIADLRHSMLNQIEPEPGPIWGYIGRRRHPMLVSTDEGFWLLWERKVSHEGSSSQPGELLGRRYDGQEWGQAFEMHEGLVSYQVPSSGRSERGVVTLAGIDTQHNLRTFGLTLKGRTPASETDVPGWEPVQLPRRERPSSRYTIELDGQTHYLYWADPHVHSKLSSDAEGEVDELMHFARDKARIDVVVMQENDSGSWLRAGPTGHFEEEVLTQSMYAMSVYYSRKYNDPGSFVAIPGWEWSARLDDNNPNHRTVMFPGSEAPILRHTDGDFDDLCDVVEAAGGIMNTQHPDYRLIEHPCDQGNIEVVSGWGNYIQPPDKVHADLDAGHEVGFIGSSDGHRRNPGTGGGLTGVYAPELTVEAIVKAFKEHRVFATNGNRIVIDARANGVFMGKDVSVQDSVQFSVTVRATKPLEHISLIRDGETIFSEKLDGPLKRTITFSDFPREGYHWYYWRVEQEGNWPDYPGNMKVAVGPLGWSSPHRVYVSR